MERHLPGASGAFPQISPWCTLDTGQGHRGTLLPSALHRVFIAGARRTIFCWDVPLALFASLLCVCPWQYGEFNQISWFTLGFQVTPAAWWDRGGQIGLKPGQSCSAGMEYTFADDPEKIGLSCMWYTNFTHIPSEPTLTPELRTFPKVEAWAEKYIARNPWMAPGSAPVFSPCGAAGSRDLKT